MSNRIMDELWQEAFDNLGVEIPIGDMVVCDICNEDYTNSLLTGGMIFMSKAVCPECYNKMMEDIVSYNEEHYIKATCPDDVTFANFVRNYRGKDSYIIVQHFN